MTAKTAATADPADSPGLADGADPADGADSPTVTVHVRYFARLREALGCSAERVAVPSAVRTAGALRAHLVARGGAFAEALGAGKAVRVAVDQVMADDEAPLVDGAEVAFFPPVTGG